MAANLSSGGGAAGSIMAERRGQAVVRVGNGAKFTPTKAIVYNAVCLRYANSAVIEMSNNATYNIRINSRIKMSMLAQNSLAFSLNWNEKRENHSKT